MWRSPARRSSRPARCWRTPIRFGSPTGKTVTAKYVLIATGGAPNHGPAIPGIEHVISSNEVFHLPELPKRIVIQGGGYIALEFACIFAGFGSDVTVVYRGDNILRGFDEDVRAHVRAEMEKAGHHHPHRLHRQQGRQARQGIHHASVERLERRLRPGDVRDRPASERRGSRAGKGRRRHQSEQWRDRGRWLVENLGAEHLCDRRRHPSHQSDAGRDPRGPCLRRHRVRQASGPGRSRRHSDRGVLPARGRHRRTDRSARRARSSATSISTRPISGRSSRRCRAATPAS